MKLASTALAWAHLVLINVGTAAAGMMIHSGQRGTPMLPVALGGRGFDAQQAHRIISPFVEPMAVSILAILAGVLARRAGYLIAHIRPERNVEKQKDSRLGGSAESV